MRAYRDSLVSPFTIMKTRSISRRTQFGAARDSGPYPSLRQAYQVLLRRKRENGEFWVEDAEGRVVDFAKLNQEGKI